MYVLPKQTNAGIFAQNYVRLDRLKAATNTTGLVCVTTPSSDNGTEADVQVAFPTGFTVSATVANWTVATTDIPSGATAWPSIGIGGSATTASGQTVTFRSADLAASTQYCFRWTGNTLTNSTAGDNKTGTITTRTGGAATVDSSTYAVSIIAEDQITVTASVPQIFTFALSGNSMPMGQLSTTSVSTSTKRTVSISTNAAGGWIAWIKGTNGSANQGALYSSSTNSYLYAPDVCTNNTPVNLSSNTGWVMDVSIDTSGTGTGTVTQAANFGAEYAGNGSTSGGSICTTLAPIAARSGTTDGDVLGLISRAKVSATQAAGSDYSDTLVVTAAGRF